MSRKCDDTSEYDSDAMSQTYLGYRMQFNFLACRVCVSISIVLLLLPQNYVRGQESIFPVFEFSSIRTEERISSFDLSPTGNRIAISYSGQRICVFDSSNSNAIANRELQANAIRFLDDTRIIGFSESSFWIWSIKANQVTHSSHSFCGKDSPYITGLVDRRRTHDGKFYYSDGEFLGILDSDTLSFTRIIRWREFENELMHDLEPHYPKSKREWAKFFLSRTLPTVRFADGESLLLSFDEGHGFLIADTGSPIVTHLGSQVLGVKSGVLRYDDGTKCLREIVLNDLKTLPFTKTPFYGTSGVNLPSSDPSCVLLDEENSVLDFPSGRRLLESGKPVLLRMTKSKAGPSTCHVWTSDSTPALQGVRWISNLIVSPNGFLFIGNEGDQHNFLIIATKAK